MRAKIVTFFTQSEVPRYALYGMWLGGIVGGMIGTATAISTGHGADVFVGALIAGAIGIVLGVIVAGIKAMGDDWA